MKTKPKVFLIVLFVLILLGITSTEAYNETNSSVIEEITLSPKFGEIGDGLVYNIRSSIFKWFQNVIEIVKSDFRNNVVIYETESKIDSDYYQKRNEKIEKSYLDTTEPPFNSSICAQPISSDANIRFAFCSCGDGVCASYEDKCNCPRDCGSCPQNTVCKRGECIEYAENTCMNTICEQGENETCPWDCKKYMQEEQEENLTNTEKEEVANRVNENRKEFLRSNGISEEEIDKSLADAENESQKETLPQEPEH